MVWRSATAQPRPACTMPLSCLQLPARCLSAALPSHQNGPDIIKLCRQDFACGCAVKGGPDLEGWPWDGGGGGWLGVCPELEEVSPGLFAEGRQWSGMMAQVMITMPHHDHVFVSGLDVLASSLCSEWNPNKASPNPLGPPPSPVCRCTSKAQTVITGQAYSVRQAGQGRQKTGLCSQHIKSEGPGLQARNHSYT